MVMPYVTVANPTARSFSAAAAGSIGETAHLAERKKQNRYKRLTYLRLKRFSLVSESHGRSGGNAGGSEISRRFFLKVFKAIILGYIHCY